MSIIKRVIDRLRNSPDRHEGQTETIVLTQDDIDAIDEYFRLAEGNNAWPLQGGRRPTDEEVALAAWANLAIEEPSVTLDDARRAVAELRLKAATQGI